MCIFIFIVYMCDHVSRVTPTAFDSAEIVLVSRFKKKKHGVVWLKNKPCEKVKLLKIYFLETNLDLMKSEVSTLHAYH